MPISLGAAIGGEGKATYIRVAVAHEIVLSGGERTGRLGMARLSVGMMHTVVDIATSLLHTLGTALGTGAADTEDSVDFEGAEPLSRTAWARPSVGSGSRPATPGTAATGIASGRCTTAMGEVDSACAGPDCTSSSTSLRVAKLGSSST